jgi:N-acetyl sugar amidotransferase
MDTTDPDISFDADGVCNHCHRYEQLSRDRLFHGNEARRRLHELVAAIKARGKGRAYDCVIGVSGGVDSTYVAYIVKKLGLRPLAVHLDNGWNSELAVSNIEKVLKRLNIDLYTHVIDWEEFRDLQLAFLSASTPDAEVPTDHAIIALLYRIAERCGLQHVLLGTNVVSEATMPRKWGYGYYDFHYIKSVHRRFGSGRLATYPYLTLPRLFWYRYVKGIRFVSILNYVDYDKPRAMELIQRDLGWVYYGGKHYESIYTRFFQAYILPRKFNIDKRRAHLSNLICSGQITLEQARSELAKGICPASMLAEDREYVMKKLGLDEEAFGRLMKLPPKTFADYPNHFALVERARRVLGRRLQADA